MTLADGRHVAKSSLLRRVFWAGRGDQMTDCMVIMVVALNDMAITIGQFL